MNKAPSSALFPSSILICITILTFIIGSNNTKSYNTIYTYYSTKPKQITKALKYLLLYYTYTHVYINIFY